VGVVPVLLLVTVALGAAWMGANGAQEPAAGPADGTATSAWAVVSVTDGDTLVVSRGGIEERVRLLGIDTPEVDQCGYAEATAAMAGLVQGVDVTLVVGSTDDRDQYDRMLRYVEVDVAGVTVDVGLRMLESGLAAEIYDSRIGYARHDREDAYIAADEAAPDLCPDMRVH
jgi:endonuclease YncB( thermonuclease family)